jgi:16S rRNA (guanine527-N7)-methyltransferase
MSESDTLHELAAAARVWGEPLNAAALDRVRSYLEFVREKNEGVNLTADSGWDDLVLKHAADGVFASSVLRTLLPNTPRILDLGAGAGFIGVILKLVWPEAEVTLMESVERKYRFLSAAAMRTGLKGLRVLNRRAGSGAALTAYERDHDCVVARALTKLPEAIRLARPLLGPVGLFAAFQSDEPDHADPALSKSMAATGVTVLKSCPYRRPREARDRRLVVFARRRD